MILYLDLDGVFADFKKRFREIIHFEYETNPQGAWSRLDQVDNLFLTIEPLPYAYDMFAVIQSMAQKAGVETKILTALPHKTNKLVTAAVDKEAWVRKHLSSTIEVICTDGWRGKRAYATPENILVDDAKRNIDDWRDAGGIGVHHTDPESTIHQLKKLLT